MCWCNLGWLTAGHSVGVLVYQQMIDTVKVQLFKNLHSYFIAVCNGNFYKEISSVGGLKANTSRSALLSCYIAVLTTEYSYERCHLFSSTRSSLSFQNLCLHYPHCNVLPTVQSKWHHLRWFIRLDAAPYEATEAAIKLGWHAAILLKICPQTTLRTSDGLACVQQQPD